MSREELDAFDKQVMHPAMPTMNFVTNIAGAMIVSEAIKLLTDTGSVCKFPKAIDFDIYHNKIKIVNLYSPLRTETYKKVLQRNKGKERFLDYIEVRKRDAGLRASASK